MTADAPTSATLSALERVRGWLRSDMRVLRWVMVAMYGVVVLAVIALAVLSGSGDAFPLLILIAVIIVAQALFIFGAGTIDLCRPVRKRRLLLPAIVAALMFTVLIAGLFLALTELFRIDEAADEDLYIMAFWGVVAASWIGWGVLIFLYAKDWPRMRVLSRLSGALFAGSLLELLATVPSHMVVIRRPGCLVGIGTMLGILAGLNVMFFSFGPMIVVLFLRPRYRRERGLGSPFCEVCGYDLRASPQRCPECGTPRQAPARIEALA